VGADRKGPLAAFVVIAIIAAVLLATSVRSQAESGEVTQQQLSASAHLNPGLHGRLGPTRATRASRDAARDQPRARGGHGLRGGQGRGDAQLTGRGRNVGRRPGDASGAHQVTLGDPHGGQGRLRPGELHGRQLVLHRHLGL